MNLHHGSDRFWTTFVEDRAEGFAGFDLHREAFGHAAVVGRTTYWDATGGFVFGTFNGADVPIEVVEAAIAEARAEIKVK